MNEDKKRKSEGFFPFFLSQKKKIENDPQMPVLPVPQTQITNSSSKSTIYF